MSGNSGNQSGVRFNVTYTTTQVGTMDAQGNININGSNVM